MLKPFLNKVLDRRNLTEEESAEMLMILTSGSAPASQSGALLAALRMKGESVEELVGCAKIMRRNARFIDTGALDCVDIVGTGGDGGKSFNISTVSAIVAAGAGVVIAKHGNRAVSGKSGSADMLAALGFQLACPPEVMEDGIREHGFGFLFAPNMHPIMRGVAGLRKELGIRTIFNLLGPLTNPAGAKGMLVGVYDSGLTELFACALRELGVRKALVVHGNDGLDEISCCAPTRVTELDHGQISSSVLYPELLLGCEYAESEIAGGDPEFNAAIARSILEGREQGAPRAAILLNAGAACYIAGLCKSIKEGISLAAESIDSGKALSKLNHLIERSCA